MGGLQGGDSGAEVGEQNTGFQLPEQDSSLNFEPGACGDDQLRLLPRIHRVGSKDTSTPRSQVHLQGPTNLCEVACISQFPCGKCSLALPNMASTSHDSR